MEISMVCQYLISLECMDRWLENTTHMSWLIKLHLTALSMLASATLSLPCLLNLIRQFFFFVVVALHSPASRPHI